MNFVCGFHAWTFDIEGKCTYIQAEHEWGGALCDEVTRLGQVKVDTWGGWVWINLDPAAEPLRDYLEPAAAMLDPFELQNMRPRWRNWTMFDCNWKVALEAFNEVYHVPGTHPEFTAFGDWSGWGRPQGKHSHIGYDGSTGVEEDKGKLRLGVGDPRISTAEMQKYTWEGVNTNTTKTLVDVAQTLPDVLPEGTPAAEVSRYWLETARAIDEKRGVFWPKVDSEHVGKSGTSWQIFPNQQIGHAVNNMLCYQARPCGFNPDKCYLRGRGLRALSRRRGTRDTVDLCAARCLPACAAAGLLQHGRRAAGHEECRLSRQHSQPQGRRRRAQPAPQPCPLHGHRRAAPARIDFRRTP